MNDNQELQATYHVVPIDDLKEHEDKDCWCNPKLIIEEDIYIFIHTSLDGREKPKH